MVAKNAARTPSESKRRSLEVAASGEESSITGYDPAELVAGDARTPHHAAIAGIGAQLRQRRLAAGLSLRQFAKQFGVSASFLSQLENGRSRPSVATLYQISSVLGVTIDELFAEAGVDATGAAAAMPEVPPEKSVSPPDPRAVGPAVADPYHGSHGSAASTVKPEARRRLVLDSGVTWEQLSSVREAGVDFMFVRYDVGGSSTVDERLTRHAGVEYG
jgi:DNA-binding XRE family transcriptional regulator